MNATETKPETNPNQHAIDNARGHAETIAEGIAAMHRADETGEPQEFDGETYDSADDIRQALENEALSVEVSGTWQPGTKPEATTYIILLTTGGPALRLTGDLGDFGPESARLEWQDWFTPWNEYRDTTTEQDAALLEFAQLFCLEQE